MEDSSPPDTLFDLSGDPALEFDADRRVAAANPAFRRTFDPESPLEDRPLERVRPTDEPIESGSDTAQSTVVTAETADGTRSFRRRVVSDSPSARGYVVYTDVTDLRNRIDELEETVDRLDQLASAVAHDIRNPLEVAKIRLDAARETGEAEHFDAIQRSFDRIETLVEELLESARAEDGPQEPRTIELADAARRAWAGVETGESEVEVEDGLGTVTADPDQLQRIFENLFRNAIDHGDPPVRVTVGPLADEPGFYVADDGPGVAPENYDSVFETGFSTTRESTGLGLSIVAGIVRSHEWSVALTESDGGGARFEFLTDAENRDPVLTGVAE